MLRPGPYSAPRSANFLSVEATQLSLDNDEIGRKVESTRRLFFLGNGLLQIDCFLSGCSARYRLVLSNSIELNAVRYCAAIF